MSTSAGSRTPSPPPLPAGAPADLTEFVACGADRVELRDGKAGWLPRPPGVPTLFAPRLAIKPAGEDAADLAIGWSVVKLTLRARITEGELRVEAHGPRVPLLNDLYTGIERWVADLNAWLAANGRRLGRPDIAAGRLTLTKEHRPRGRGKG